jgi:hypothetical protein
MRAMRLSPARRRVIALMGARTVEEGSRRSERRHAGGMSRTGKYGQHRR